MIKRITCAAALLLSFSLLLAGCSKKTLSEDTLILNGEKIRVDYVLKIDDYVVKADEYRYFFMNVKDQMTGGDSSYQWTEETAEELKERTLEYITINRAVVIFAQNKGLSITDEEKKQIESDIKTSISSAGGKDEFIERLTSGYMTESLFRSMAEISAIQQKLYDTVFSNGGEMAFTDEEMIDIVNKDYVCVRYLMLSRDSDGTTENKDLADSLLRRIRGGEDFSTLVYDYGEDSTMKYNEDGTYFTKGMTDSAVEQASFSLGIGEISDVIEGDDGYYIIKRLPIDQDYVRENIDDIINGYQEMLFSDELKEISAQLTIAYGNVYEKISVESMG